MTVIENVCVVGKVRGESGRGREGKGKEKEVWSFLVFLGSNHSPWSSDRMISTLGALANATDGELVASMDKMASFMVMYVPTCFLFSDEQSRPTTKYQTK